MVNLVESIIFERQASARVYEGAHLCNEAIEKYEEVITVKVRIVDNEGTSGVAGKVLLLHLDVTLY